MYDLSQLTQWHKEVTDRVFTGSSKRPALARVFWIHLLKVCWTCAGSCKHPISQNYSVYAHEVYMTTANRITLTPELTICFCQKWSHRYSSRENSLLTKLNTHTALHMKRKEIIITILHRAVDTWLLFQPFCVKMTKSCVGMRTGDRRQR